MTMPVVILHGFLGSGKTTLLRKVLAQSAKADCVPGVIVNDMSELDVDGVLVSNTELVDDERGNFVTISGDSISSSKGIKSLNVGLKKLKQQGGAAWVIIETSGSSHPLPLIDYFKKNNEFTLKGVITLVDANWLKADYEFGKQLMPKWQKNMADDVRGIENILVEQILFSNKVILTKTDKITEQAVMTIAKSLHPLNPYADIITAQWGNIDFAMLQNLPDYNFYLVEQLANELRGAVNQPLTLSGKGNQKLVAKVLKDDRPFHPMRLWEICHNHMTQGVFRSKGFFWLPNRDDVSLLWSQANASVGLEVVGFWRAPILEDETQKFDQEHLRILEQKIQGIDSRFGDRRCHLTVIGQKDEVNAFIKALKTCFLSDDEISHWQQGGNFTDPWPTHVAKA